MEGRGHVLVGTRLNPCLVNPCFKVIHCHSMKEQVPDLNISLTGFSYSHVCSLMMLFVEYSVDSFHIVYVI